MITILTLVRRVMDGAGDRRKPIILTEVNWPSALHRTPYHIDFEETTPAGQGRRLAAMLPLLAQYRTRLGIAAFYYYTWISSEVPGGSPFNFAGLLGMRDGRVFPQPALGEFRRAALALEQPY